MYRERTPRPSLGTQIAFWILPPSVFFAVGYWQYGPPPPGWIGFILIGANLAWLWLAGLSMALWSHLYWIEHEAEEDRQRRGR